MDETPFRQGDTILRPVRPWTKSVHALLGSLRRHGFQAAPIPMGCDEVWETVSYLPGTTGDLDSNGAMASETILKSAAALLRRYHDCSALCLADLSSIGPWQLPKRDPREIICHGDFAPYNVVLNGDEVTGIIDFEAAHPGPRSWDLAYAIYRWAPLSSQISVERLDKLDAQIRRARIFADSYEMPSDERNALPPAIIARLKALLDFMEHEAARGVEKYRLNIEQGHDRVYRLDIDYISAFSAEIAQGLTQ